MIRIPIKTHQDDSMESKELFFFVAHVSMAVSQIGRRNFPCQLVASHMCSRVWGNSDIFEAKRNADRNWTSLDTARVAGMGFRRNEENPKLVELFFSKKNRVFFCLYSMAIKRNTIYHNIADDNTSMTIVMFLSYWKNCRNAFF